MDAFFDSIHIRSIREFLSFPFYIKGEHYIFDDSIKFQENGADSRVNFITYPILERNKAAFRLLERAEKN